MDDRRGNGIATATALGAFGLWGVLPLYWKALGNIGTLTVVAHRILWSLAILMPLLALQSRLGEIRAAFAKPRLLCWHFVSGLLLGTNWFVYIHATLTNRIMEGALGYFLNPLFSVALGWLLLKEPRSHNQILAITLATVGVIIQSTAIAGIPWIALTLAGSFALYALARKKSPLGSVDGLAVETLMMVPVAIAILWNVPSPSAAPALLERVLLAGTGLATTVPLIFFAFAARRMRLATLGMLQFLGPTMQFLIGLFVYHEPISPVRLVSFVFIWLGVGVFIRNMRES